MFSTKTVLRYTLLLFMLLCLPTVYAQTLTTGKNLYRQGRYEEAAKVFAKHIRNYRSNASVNHWYGVSLYETGRKEEAEKYLQVAASKDVQESFRYLGAYTFEQYRYEESVAYYEKYKSMLEKDKKPTEVVDSLIALSRMGERMMRGLEMVQIIDSVVVDKENFLSHYELSPEAGSLYSYNQFFEESSPIATTVHRTQRGDRVVYAELNAEGDLDIFSRNQLLDDMWSDRVSLSDNINTTANENYPFLLSDGVTLYFASDGADSFGGYDIFITRLNLNSGKYLAPENVGMPFNSPFNDYLLAVDEAHNVGWFVTDRYQPADKVVVYMFIPNATRTTYRGEDKQLAINLARITSIKDTWKPNVDYQAILDDIQNRASEEEETDEFVFVINNKLVYTQLTHFDSDEARSLFIKASDLELQLERLQRNLRELRLQYSHNHTPAITAKILKLEEQLLQLYGKPEATYIEARNAEIRYLKALNTNR